MSPDDIPVSVTQLVYTDPHDATGRLSQNQLAIAFTHYWPEIQRCVREQVAREIETNADPAPWMYDLGDGSVVNGSWIDRRDGLKAAWIARGTNQPAVEESPR